MFPANKVYDVWYKTDKPKSQIELGENLQPHQFVDKIKQSSRDGSQSGILDVNFPQ